MKKIVKNYISLNLDSKVDLVLILFMVTLNMSIVWSQSSGVTFEMRQFTQDQAANGETDFKGETEWLDTEGRVRFLNQYADFSSRYFNNPDMDLEIVNDQEIDSLLAGLKPQPTPSVRQDIDLREWKAYGYRSGQDKETEDEHTFWESMPGAVVRQGAMVL